MEKRLTKKEVQEYYKNIISIGYCSAQCLLKGLEREGWTCGVYGWNADVYEINRTTAIVTGYRPFGNIDNKYKYLREYEEKAEKICKDYSLEYKDAMKKIAKLRNEYVEKTLKEWNESEEK